MKLSQKQSQLLASEVLKALKKQGASHIPELTIAKLREWFEKREKLKKAVKDSEAAADKHDSALYAITGENKRIRPYHSVSEIVKTLKEGITPSLSEIEDKIILKAMFTNEDDLQTFVQGIVKEFTKNKPVAAN